MEKTAQCQHCPMYQRWCANPDKSSSYYTTEINNQTLVNEADKECTGPKAFADSKLLRMAVELETDDTKLVIDKEAITFQCENPRFYGGTM